MVEIAKVAQISRPALYLIFPSKEEAFAAVLDRVFKRMLEEIRQRIGGFPNTREKLYIAFDLWLMGPLELVHASPDAKNLFDTHFEFAAKVRHEALEELKGLVADLLEPSVKKQSRVELSCGEIAEALTDAVDGLRGTGKTIRELRHLVRNLLSLVLAGVDEFGASSDFPQAVECGQALGEGLPGFET